MWQADKAVLGRRLAPETKGKPTVLLLRQQGGNALEAFYAQAGRWQLPGASPLIKIKERSVPPHNIAPHKVREFYTYRKGRTMPKGTFTDEVVHQDINRSATEYYRVYSAVNGDRTIVDVRLFRRGPNTGLPMPSRKGVTFVAKKADQVANAIQTTAIEHNNQKVEIDVNRLLLSQQAVFKNHEYIDLRLWVRGDVNYDQWFPTRKAVPIGLPFVEKIVEALRKAFLYRLNVTEELMQQSGQKQQ